jgi:hypothetical protein
LEPQVWKYWLSSSPSAADFEAGVFGAEEIDQFVVDDFDDLLAGLDAEEDVLAEGFFFDALDEIAGDFEIDVGVEQGQPDIAQSGANVFLGNFSEAAQVFEDALQLAAESIEHGGRLNHGFSKNKIRSATRPIRASADFGRCHRIWWWS